MNGTQLGIVGSDAINPGSVDGTASRYTVGSGDSLTGMSRAFHPRLRHPAKA